jgi:hypothetical protein
MFIIGRFAFHTEPAAWVAEATMGETADVCYRRKLGGGLKRSSQHLDEGRCDEETQAASGPVWAGAGSEGPVVLPARGGNWRRFSEADKRRIWLPWMERQSLSPNAPDQKGLR